MVIISLLQLFKRRSSQVKVGNNKESEKWKSVSVQMMSDESTADDEIGSDSVTYTVHHPQWRSAGVYIIYF